MCYKVDMLQQLPQTARGTCHKCAATLARKSGGAAVCEQCKTRFHTFDCGRRYLACGFEAPLNECPKCNHHCKCSGGPVLCHAESLRKKKRELSQSKAAEANTAAGLALLSPGLSLGDGQSPTVTEVLGHLMSIINDLKSQVHTLREQVAHYEATASLAQASVASSSVHAHPDMGGIHPSQFVDDCRPDARQQDADLIRQRLWRMINPSPVGKPQMSHQQDPGGAGMRPGPSHLGMPEPPSAPPPPPPSRHQPPPPTLFRSTSPSPAIPKLDMEMDTTGSAAKGGGVGMGGPMHQQQMANLSPPGSVPVMLLMPEFYQNFGSAGTSSTQL